MDYNLCQKTYIYIFWFGYFAVLTTTFVPIVGNLTKIKLGFESFQICLDHLLHLSVYFLICMYYLAGQLMRLKLFNTNSLAKFILLVLVLASVTEVVQLWVPERTFNPMDWVANVMGLLVGVVAIVMTRGKVKRRIDKWNNAPHIGF